MNSIFISYSHKDEAWKERLMTHLGPLSEQTEFEVWEDRQILAGDDWLARIEEAMSRCRLAVLLISPDFLQSEFITRKEVPALLRRRETAGMRVIPILLRSCVWKHIPWLTPIQMRPKDGITVASKGDLDSEPVGEALVAIATGINDLLRSLPPENPTFTQDPLLREYLTAVTEQTGVLKLVGLAANLRVNLSIDDAYVPLRVMHSERQELDDCGLPGPKSRLGAHQETDTDVEELFKCAVRHEQRGAVILGMPGAGKTTAARRLCWRLARENGSAVALGLPEGVIPVFLPLRQLAPAKVDEGLEAFLERQVEGLIGTDKTRELNALGRPALLWVFDGLDEVVNEPTRAHISGLIQQLLWKRGKDRFLVTSRYSGYRREAQFGADFLTCHVGPLDGAEVTAFVQKWYAAVGKALGPGSLNAPDEARSLLSILAQPEYRIGNLRGLRSNPLLLTILSIVHQQDRNLPGKRVELYRRCVRVLLESWRRESREAQGGAPYDANAAENALAVLAWWMHQEEKRSTATLDEAAAQLHATLAELPADSGLPQTGRAFLEKVRDESGVLAPAGPGMIGFLHQTFQEYLAARYAVEERESGALVARLGESWWRETTLLALAQGTRPFCRDFFQDLANGGRFAQDAEFFDQCIEEAAFFVADPFLKRLRAPGASDAEQVEILRRLRTRPSPALAEVCRELVKQPGELGRLAREIVAGQTVATEPDRTAEGTGTMTDPRTGLGLIWVAPGEFQMGSDRGRDNEKPVHLVRLTRGFWLSRNPVTNEDYQRFLEASEQQAKPALWDNSRFNGKRQPVVGVGWKEANAYCQWAGCRMPTEAEWEYACRAGSPHEYCFGKEEEGLSEFAWYGEWGTGSTHPVGQKKPNEWGLYDMHGNVWEWCEDWYGEYPKGTVTDPTGPKSGSNRVFRGGGWNSPAEDCRSAYRSRYHPSYRDLDLGFRVVLSRSSVPEQVPVEQG